MLLIFGNFSLLWRKQEAAYCAALVLESAATPLHFNALAHKQKDAHAAPHCFVKVAKTFAGPAETARAAAPSESPS